MEFLQPQAHAVRIVTRVARTPKLNTISNNVYIVGSVLIDFDTTSVDNIFHHKVIIMLLLYRETKVSNFLPFEKSMKCRALVNAITSGVAQEF